MHDKSSAYLTVFDNTELIKVVIVNVSCDALIQSYYHYRDAADQKTSDHS